MYTERVLGDIGRGAQESELTLSQRRSTLQWLGDSVFQFPTTVPVDQTKDAKDETVSLQQTDLLRGFYLTIAKHGLHAAFKQAAKSDRVSTAHEGKRVIIVGAGMSGLVAAYELAKEKYSVEILEMSQRFGGRVKTFTQKDGFDRGLHADAGAMRIPQPPPAEGEHRPTDKMIHYLTDYYALDVLRLRAVPFSNYDSDAYYMFYGDRIKIRDWQNAQFTKYWPGWDARIAVKQLPKEIRTIDEYHGATIDVVINLLKKRLADVDPSDLKAQAEQWDKWTKNWCQFSIGFFLRSTLEAIKGLVVFDCDDKVSDKDVQELDLYLPWPEAAMTAFSVFNFTAGESISLVQVLHERMAHRWSHKMHSLEGGLSALPEALAAKEIEGQGKHVEQFITYNRMVTKVVYGCADGNKSVEVHGVITSSGEPFVVRGRSVILTVPLHVLRGIKIVNAGGAPGLPIRYQKAIENISYMPSTKIMLQYKRQFWNHGEDKITGGFSKTNLPIGQLHYPTNVEVKGDLFVDLPAPPDESGILMVYTVKAEALLWGALTEEQAIMLAVNQIDEIHPGSKKWFQMGKRQAWASDPTTLGAFALLQPEQYISVMYLMHHSWKNVYFAGEAISFANGWIQGALESGLRAAYQLYSDDQLLAIVTFS